MMHYDVMTVYYTLWVDHKNSFTQNLKRQHKSIKNPSRVHIQCFGYKHHFDIFSVMFQLVQWR